jgi:hypothetical protein
MTPWGKKHDEFFSIVEEDFGSGVRELDPAAFDDEIWRISSLESRIDPLI